MRVLVIGGGGREHALCWKIARSPLCEQLFACPGNAGIAEVASLVHFDVTDHSDVLESCSEFGIDLVIVGPEAPLCDGLADTLRAAGIAVFGPSAAASQLEGSKAWAKAFMARHGVPTADAWAFDDADALSAHLSTCPVPVVVKADGLAGGKGVLICMNREEALEAARAMTTEARFGDAASCVVVEEFMVGEEASVFALVEGDTVVPLQPLQDHKRRFDGDQGPNTGGMGAYTPVPAVDGAMLQRIVDEVLVPVAEGLCTEGTPYRGLLYAGLMLTDEGPRVVEFNCRFGDPECQPLLLALDSDLLPLLAATAKGELAGVEAPVFAGGASLCVVLVSEGYPGSYPTGRRIDGLESLAGREDVVVFHAGTVEVDGHTETAGGRVLGVTARGPSVEEARRLAYEAVELISFEGMGFRNDIAHRALSRG